MRPKPTIQEKALDLLSRRSLTRGELKAKLLQRGYRSGEIEPQLDHYEDLGFLNDGVLAMDYTKYTLESRPMSRRMLKYELKKRLFPEEIIEMAVEAVFAETSDREMAERAYRLEAKHSKDRKKIYNRLLRLGFDYEVVSEVMTGK